MSDSESKPIIIVGGGIIGVTTLYELASRGVPALLLEEKEDLALETSFANGGMLTPSTPDPWNSPGVAEHLFSSILDPTSSMKLHLREVPDLMSWGPRFLLNSVPARYAYSTAANYILAAYSVRLTDELNEKNELPYDRSDVGTMKVFEGETALKRSLSVAEKLSEHGLTFSKLNVAEVLQKEPQLSHVSNRLCGAIFYPDDRCGDARLFTLSLASEAQRLGGEIRNNARVKRLRMMNGSIVGVELQSGEVISGGVVLAAGVKSPVLARHAGLRLPIKPAKGYSLTLRIKENSNEPPRIAVVDDAMHAAVVPLGDRLRLVGTAEFAGHDQTIQKQRIENLFSLFQRLYPHLAGKVDRETEEPWAGLRPMTADGRPFIGPSPRKGLWLNCGHGHLGWTKAMGSARILADLICGQSPEIDTRPFTYR